MTLPEYRSTALGYHVGPFHCKGYLTSVEISNFLSTWTEMGRSQVFNGVLLLLFFPEGEILLKEFDDRFGISEGLLIDVINLLESIWESSFSKLTGFLVLVHNFVVEDREVKSESKSDWVASIEGFGTGLGKFVVLKSTVLNDIELITLSALGNVSVVITDHLVEESFGLISGGNIHAWILNDADDADALVVKLLLDLLLVLGESIIKFGVFWVLLDGRDGSNGGSLGSNLVLETNREEVSLFGGEILALGFDNSLEVLDHIVESLGLLGNSGHENVLF
jgi:hypothetical protein